MKQIINQFTNGLVSDMHPLTTDDKGIVDALNATLITYNGNEMILQNDMGNTLIQDSATGNIMGLSPGFIPIGLKEHGGIMYIASVNKDGIGEIGTIPSPIIRDFYKDLTAKSINEFIPIGSNPPIKITNKLYPADKFIANLRMVMNNSNEFIGVKTWSSSLQSDATNGDPDFDPNDCILTRYVLTSRLDPSTIPDAATQTNWAPTTLTWDEINTPIITYSDDVKCPSTLTHKKGIYSFNIHSTNEQGSRCIPQSNSLYNGQEFTYGGVNSQSNYWYLHSNSPQSYFPKDLLSATLNKNLKTFPTNSKPGYLAVSLQPETMGTFGMINRTKDPVDVPYTYKYKNGGNITYYSFFPGFYYTTESGIYVDKLKINVIDESTGQVKPLHYLKGDTTGTAHAFEQSASNGYTCTFKAFNPINVSTPSSTLLISPKTDNIYSTDWIFAPRTGNSIGGTDPTYFQVKSDEPNTYLLTNQPFITTYKKTTTYISTDNSTDVHTGLFCATLGEDWNKWFRLEVEYFDQYGELQGFFTKRFNPYLNDVFGTNLSLSGIEKAKGIDLQGADITIPGVIVTTAEQTKTITYKNATLYKTDYQREHPQYLTSHGLAPTQNVFTATWYSGNSWNTTKQISCTATTNYSAYSKEVAKNYDYLYGTNNLSLTAKTTDFAPTIDKLALSIIGAKYGYNDPFYTRNDSNSAWEGHKVKKSSSYFGTLRVTNAYNYTLSNTYEIGQIKFNKHNEDSLSVPTISSGGAITTSSTLKSLLFTSSNPTFNKPSIGANTTSFIIEIPAMYHELRGNFYNSDDAKWQFVGSSEARATQEICFPGSPTNNYLTLTATITVPSKTITWPSQTLSPKYQIVPMFTLKGKNDKNEDIYISKVHHLDDQLYESNFVCDSSGIPINYSDSSNLAINSSNKSAGSSFSTPAYKTIEDTETFKANNLAAGIYVFYMTAVGSANAVCYTDDYPYSQILVNIDGAETEFIGPSRKEYFYRAAGSTQNHYISTFSSLPSPLTSSTVKMTFINQYGVGGNHYWPIVIILPYSCTELTFTMKNLTGGTVKWSYQDAGLYRIKDVSEEDFVELENLSKTTQVMYYWEYHRKVQQCAPIKSDEPVQYRNYVQKFGVFFRQAYTYKEAKFTQGGLVGSVYINSTISDIKCADSTFTDRQLFVPADPYIINWILDWRDFYPYSKGSGTVKSTKNGSSTALCLYMPDAALTSLKFFPIANHETDSTFGNNSITTQLKNANLLPSWNDVRILR